MESDFLPEQNVLLSPIESSPHEHNRILAARLQALEEAMSDLCWITTDNGHFLTEQPPWTCFTGQSPVQAMGKGWLDAVHPDDRKSLETAYTQCVQMGQPCNTVCLVKNAEDHYKRLSIRCIPVRHEAGDVREVMYLGTPLLSDQHPDKWLRQMGVKHLEAMIDLAHDAILVLDSVDGRILSWNQGATNLYGYSAEEAVGKIAPRLLQVQTSTMSGEEFVRLLMHDGKWEGELTHVCRDGHMVTVDARFVVMHSEDGQPQTVLEVSRDITERKRTEQLLKEYIQLAETAGRIGLWTCDLVHKTGIFFSPKNMTFPIDPDHESSQPISYEQFLQTVHPDDREATDTALREALELKGDYINEYRTIHPKHGILWYMGYGRAIYDEQGKPIRMVGIVLNITERKRIEQALQEANEQVTAIIESITDSFIYLNREWRYVYVNSQTCRDLGKSRDELLGRVVWEVHPKLQNTLVEQKYRETMEERKGKMFDVFFEPTGRWFSMRTYPAREGITVFVTDITERMQMEDALRKSEAKFRRLVEANVGGVIVGDSQGKIYEANDAFLKLIGFTREDLERGELNWRALTPPDYRQVDERATQELQETGVCQSYEKEWLTKQGKRVPVLVTGTSIEDTPKKAIIFMVDLSRQKELEKQREHFLRLVSHELRTPLTAINGSLQLVQRRLLRAKQSQELQTPVFEEIFNKFEESLLQSVRQTNALNRLINDLIESARITAEKLSLTLEPHNLVEIVRTTVEDMRFSVPERHILVEDMPQEAQVLVDAGRISQVVANFISNALKYSPHEMPIVVGLALDDQEARVWVHDWGQGLSPIDQQFIWQRYFQGNGAQDREVKSVNLGLGLHLCKLLIQQHNGHVGVESQLGEGSTFWFTLPLHPDH